MANRLFADLEKAGNDQLAFASIQRQRQSKKKNSNATIHERSATHYLQHVFGRKSQGGDGKLRTKTLFWRIGRWKCRNHSRFGLDRECYCYRQNSAAFATWEGLLAQ